MTQRIENVVKGLVMVITLLWYTKRKSEEQKYFTGGSGFYGGTNGVRLQCLSIESSGLHQLHVLLLVFWR